MGDYLKDLNSRKKIVLKILKEYQEKDEDAYLTHVLRKLKERYPSENESSLRDTIIYLAANGTILIDKGPRVLKLSIKG